METTKIITIKTIGESDEKRVFEFFKRWLTCNLQHFELEVCGKKETLRYSEDTRLRENETTEEIIKNKEEKQTRLGEEIMTEEELEEFKQQKEDINEK